MVDKSLQSRNTREEKLFTPQRHDSKISGSPQTMVLQIWQKKIDMYEFVHDCTQEQSGSPYFSSITQQCKKDCQEGLLRPSNFATMET